ncbi:MAG: histidine kinase dimerization/phosphoacceptor domain -containing protein [Bacteroidota bacterium]
MHGKLGVLGLLICSAMLCLQAQSTDSLIRYWEVRIGEVRATSLPEVSEVFIDEALRSTSNKAVKGAIYMAKTNLAYDHPDYYEKALYAADRAIKIFEDLDSTKRLAEAFYAKSFLFIKEANYDSSYFYLDKSEQYYLQMNSTKRLARIELERGNISAYQSNYEKAQAHYYRALQLYEKLDDKSGMIYCFYFLGELLHNCCQQYDKAKKLYNKAAALFPQTKTSDNAMFAKVLNQLGNMYMYDKYRNLSVGLKYHYQALELLEALQQRAGPKYYHPDIAATYQMIANNLMLQKDYRKALETFQLAYQLFDERENYERFACLVAIGEAKAALSQYEQAVEAIEKSKTEFIAQRDFTNLKYANEALSKIYEQKGDYENALTHYKTYKSYNDSILDEEKVTSMRVTELNYTYGKQRELDSLEARNEQLALANELGQYKSTRNYLGIILVLVLFGAGVIYWLYYKRNQANLQLQTTNQALQEQTDIVAQQNADLATKNQENEVLLKEIHHRVKNNLQTISSLLSMQSATLTEEKAQVAIMQSQSRVQSIALIHQKLYQRDQLMGIEIKSYLDTLIQNLHNIFTIDSQRIVFHFSGKNLIFHLDAALPIALIINELLTNSFKYAFPNEAKGNVYLDLQQLDKTILIQYSDDGIGIAKNRNTQGFGTRLVNLLCLQLNGTIERLETEKGVAYQLEVKKYRLVE